MPFKSQAQRGYLYANNPKVAKEFESKTPVGKKLPYHAKSKKSSKARDKLKSHLAKKGLSKNNS